MLHRACSYRLWIFPVITSLLVACGGRSPQQENTGVTSGSGAPPTAPPAASPSPVTIKSNPFAFCLGSTVCTPDSSQPPAPLPYSYTENTAPAQDPATAGVFPAFGWLLNGTGTTSGATIPASIWQGNRAAAQESGTVCEVTSVAGTNESSTVTTLALNTNCGPTAGMATLVITTLDTGAKKLVLSPPAGVRSQVALTIFSIDTPVTEGLYGLGARKDRFNQRGHLRNVWTEQQNTGLATFKELRDDPSKLGRVPSPLTHNLPGPVQAVSPEDAAFQDDRATFPNGAQAAYWVESFVVGSRGWGAWVDGHNFQRLDLAAENPTKIRWSITAGNDAGRDVTLVFADGGIEAASKAYTDYWGKKTTDGKRPPAPDISVYGPLLSTLNQGEGEAAPNGQGFWGGHRARCEMMEFINKSQQHQLPFTLIGVEGWQNIPNAHPSCLQHSVSDICRLQLPADQRKATYPTDQNGYDNEQFSWYHTTSPNCTGPNGDNFLEWVKQQGFEVTGYWNMFHTDPQCPGGDKNNCTGSIGVPLESMHAFYDAKAAGLYVKDNVGNDYSVVTNRQGLSHIIDFTNPASFAFWKTQLYRMWNQGITIFMHDFGELTTTDMAFHSGEPIDIAHNRYAYDYHKAAREAADDWEAENPGKRIFFYGRAGMTGACALTPGTFPGDESTTWDNGHGLPSIIPTMLNLALSGCYTFSTDVGGYFDIATPRTTEELFIRWSQASALTPMMRLHNSTFSGSVYPWTYVDAGTNQHDVIGIFRKYARLKNRLNLSVVDPWSKRAAADGTIGPVRPLILEDTSAAALAVEYQWLFGSDILVAPVIAPGATTVDVYFPNGANWELVTVDATGNFVNSGQIFTGGTTVTVPVTIDDIPIFLRR